MNARPSNPHTCHREERSDVAIQLARSGYQVQMDCRVDQRTGRLAMTSIHDKRRPAPPNLSTLVLCHKLRAE